MKNITAINKCDNCDELETALARQGIDYGHSLSVLERERDAHKLASENLTAECSSLHKEVDRLKAYIAKFQLWGTDGCTNCETGRVTLFTQSKICTACENAVSR